MTEDPIVNENGIANGIVIGTAVLTSRGEIGANGEMTERHEILSPSIPDTSEATTTKTGRSRTGRENDKNAILKNDLITNAAAWKPLCAEEIGPKRTLLMASARIRIWTQTSNGNGPTAVIAARAIEKRQCRRRTAARRKQMRRLFTHFSTRRSYHGLTNRQTMKPPRLQLSFSHADMVKMADHNFPRKAALTHTTTHLFPFPVRSSKLTLAANPRAI